MKRFIFSAIALMVAATACTESGIIDTPSFYGNAIIFDTYIGKTPVTKAEDCDIDYLKSTEANGGGAQVYAFKCDVGNTNRDYVDYSSAYLDGKLIYSSPTWGYYVNGELEDPYMPTDKDLAVVAYNLKAAGTASTPYMTNISSDKMKFDFTVMNDVASQVDLLVTPLTFVSENGGDVIVPLRFYHLLSRVGFKVLATGASEVMINFTSIKVCGTFPTTGHVDMTLATATPASSSSDLPIDLTGSRRPAITSYSTSYAYEYSLLGGSSFNILADDCDEEAQPIYTSEVNNRFMMLMPGQVGNVNGSKPYIEVVYSLAGGDPQKSTIWLTETLEQDGENWTFEAGRAYEFVLKLSTATIEFSAEIVEGGWDEGHADGETPVYPQS